ncbi:MAG: CHASE3 domain-containing protein [Proteobacteria bacterium]|nr:CHASE3 domain-containing protein [Pseudomonadota bacterium]
MRSTGRKIFRELATGIGALVVAVLAQTVIVWAVIDNLQRIDVADGEARSELQLYSRMFEAALDADSALRGFLIDGDAKALKIHDDGVSRFEAATPRLRAFTADDPPYVRATVEDIISRAETWEDKVAQPQIAAVKAGRRPVWDSVQDQVAIEVMRRDFQTLRRFESDELSARAQLWSAALVNGRITLILGSAIVLVFAVLIALRSVRRVLRQRETERAAAARVADALERVQAAERAKTTFLANMSHEMLTPLNGVLGMAAALGMSGLNDRQQGMLGIIRNSAADLEGLIGNLLTLSRAAEVEDKPATDWAFDLGDEVRVIAEDHAAAARKKGVRFATDIPPEAEISVRGDAARVERVLNCLLSNAVKFTERGEIRLGVTRLAGDTYRFDVSDTGIGFDEAEKATLFASFTQSDDSSTRRFGGAGVGLAVASKIARELGGRLDGRSKPGEGAHFTFEVELPAAGARPAASPRPPLAA